MVSPTTALDVCQLDHIYNEKFTFSLPRSILEGYLSGVAFDNKVPYNPAEMASLQEDINEIYQNIVAADPLKKSHIRPEPLAVITAGAPGAGKTTLLEADLKNQEAIYARRFSYTDPDAVCLKQQRRTYQFDIGKDTSPAARFAAYNKWRPASNAANQLILANLIREKYFFYFGTTATSPTTGKFLEFLKAQGYMIRILHITAPDEVRVKSIQERDKTFIQTTPEDITEKGKLLPQRISDTYLKYADRIEFYYRGGVDEKAQLAATWTRNEKGAEKLGLLEILDPSTYEEIKKIHNTTVKALNRLDLKWEDTVEKQSKISSFGCG